MDFDFIKLEEKINEEQRRFAAAKIEKDREIYDLVSNLADGITTYIGHSGLSANTSLEKDRVFVKMHNRIIKIKVIEAETYEVIVDYPEQATVGEMGSDLSQEEMMMIVLRKIKEA